MDKNITIFCDLDGTLVDTALANASAYANAFRVCGFEIDVDAFLIRYNGVSKDRFIPEVTKSDDKALFNKISDHKKDIYHQYFGETHIIHPVEKLLLELRHSHKIFLVTTASRKSAEALLAYHELSFLFTDMICGEDVKIKKPSPECYYLALKVSGANPSDCLVIEDSETGVSAAKAASLNVLKIC